MTLRYHLQHILGESLERARQPLARDAGIPAVLLGQLVDKYIGLVERAQTRCASEYHRRRLIQDLCDLQTTEFCQLHRILEAHVSRRLRDL